MLNRKKILIIDDDVILCRSTSLIFSREGAIVRSALDGKEGLQQFFDFRPDLVILDIMMPELDGWEVCKQIRLMSKVPIILLTTLHKEDSVIKGLDAGADDFVSKPFTTGILLARARALLRRAEQKIHSPEQTQFKDSYLQVDIHKRLVYVKGQSIKLSSREFELLTYLLKNSGLVVTYQQILERVWGWEYHNNVEYVHVYVSQLRRKIEANPKKPQYILTEHNVGYRFNF
jgi:two-component system KDP operon response regulator KdpE